MNGLGRKVLAVVAGLVAGSLVNMAVLGIGGQVIALPAVLVGAFFLAGGIAASVMLPAPAWFIAADLVLAYVPAAWLGWRLAQPRGR